MLGLIALLGALSATDSLPESPAEESHGSAAAISFIVHRQPAIPMVALRLAILADDPDGYAGAGHLFQHLAFARLKDQAARAGATVEMQRTSDAIVYTMVGPTVELDYMAGLLRAALRPERPTEAAVLMARRALAEERLAEWENADQHVRAAVRARLFPNDLPAAGTERSAARLTVESLPAVWARLYRPERVSMVAVGDVRLPQVEEAFRDLPAAPQARAPAERQDTISLVPLAPAQATRAWVAAGYLANDLEPTTLTVTARLLRDDLRRRIPGAEVEVEHWWTHFGQAVVLVVSTPEQTLAAARRALSTAVSTLGTDVTERRVAGAARAVRGEILFYARTPRTMAEVLGRFADRDGQADAAQVFYAELSEVDVDEVRDALKYLVERSPVRVEIPPQKLNRTP